MPAAPCPGLIAWLCRHSADKVVYTAVTVGCPTAYRFKYKGGGLAKMQLLPSIMPSVGSFSTTAENKAFRVKSLLGE